MERATLAKRCIFIEADKRVKETDIKQIFNSTRMSWFVHHVWKRKYFFFFFKLQNISST
jgi:hypothetical protein